jgi:hypothetical protein
MSVFDAIGHSYATVAIGGFSTHDASIGYFDSVAVEEKKPQTDTKAFSATLRLLSLILI